MFLALSSSPLHLLYVCLNLEWSRALLNSCLFAQHRYNSALYEQKAVYNYTVFAAEESLLNGTAPLTEQDKQMMTNVTRGGFAPAQPYYKSWDEFQYLLQDQIHWERLDDQQCISKYHQDRVSDRADLIWVVNRTSTPEDHPYKKRVLRVARVTFRWDFPPSSSSSSSFLLVFGSCLIDDDDDDDDDDEVWRC